MFFIGGKHYPAPGTMRDAYTEGDPSIESAAYVAGQELERPYMSALIPNPVFTEDESAELTTLKADVDTYRQETFTNMISGKLGMDQWDAYVSQMKALGSDRMEEIYNVALVCTFQS
jgi:hypothetical protein